MTPADPRARARLLSGLLLLATFAAGAFVGAGLLRAATPPAPPAAAASPALPPLPAARLPRELRLTAAQEARAREIGDRYRPELEALARELKPRVRAVQDRMEAEFFALLTPEQRAQLAAIEERRRNPPRDGEPGRGGGGGGEGTAAAPPSDRAPGTGHRTGEPGPRKAMPQEAIDACLHLDVDQLCRFLRGGREVEGSCRPPPPGEEGPVACRPDRRLPGRPAPEAPGR